MKAHRDPSFTYVFLSKFNNLVAAATIPGDAETSLGVFELAGAPWTNASEPFTVIINAGELKLLFGLFSSMYFQLLYVSIGVSVKKISFRLFFLVY